MPKKVIPLADTTLAKTKVKDKQYILNDGDGLRFIVTPQGRRFFRFDYTRPNRGKRNSLTIGNYPEITLGEAREKRAEYRKLLTLKIDPAKQKNAVTIQDLFKDISADYLAVVKKSVDADSTYLNYKRYVKYMNAEFGDKDFIEIEIRDISKLITYYDKQNKHETARRVLRLLKSIYKYAISRGIIKHNIANDIDSNILIAKVKPISFAHIDDEKEFAILLNSIDDYFGDIMTKYALQFQSMTFLRPENVRFLRWARIDFEKKQIVYPETEMKNKLKFVVPLTEQIETVLLAAAALSKGRSEFVFPSPTSNLKPLSENTLNQALQRLGYKGKMTSHGFRHSASTFLNENKHIHKVSGDVIEAQMAHIDSSVRGIYNHAEYLPERFKLLGWWCSYLDRVKKLADKD